MPSSLLMDDMYKSNKGEIREILQYQMMAMHDIVAFCLSNIHVLAVADLFSAITIDRPTMLQCVA